MLLRALRRLLSPPRFRDPSLEALRRRDASGAGTFLWNAPDWRHVPRVEIPHGVEWGLPPPFPEGTAEASAKVFEEALGPPPPEPEVPPPPAAVAEPTVTPGEPPEVFFRPGEPQTLKEFDGQEHITEYLDLAIRGLPKDVCAVDPQMFLGMAGSGKTLLAKIVANELRLRARRLGLPAVPQFIEAFPADIPDIASLDELMRRIVEHPGSVVFVDEIHDLIGSHARKLYLVLAEGRYQFHGDPFPIRLPPVTLIAATTDYGAMHAALKRRWERHMFRPASVEQLVGYVRRRPFPIADALARKIVGRTKFSGAPWEALEIYRMASTAARGRESPEVGEEDVDRIFRMQELDTLGLRWMDRKVVEALLGLPRYRQQKGQPKEFVCFAASLTALSTMAGIDRAEYVETIQPRLLSRRLLEVRFGYGQALTQFGVKTYGHLNPDALLAVGLQPPTGNPLEGEPRTLWEGAAPA